jgi:hypothetical protein
MLLREAIMEKIIKIKTVYLNPDNITVLEHSGDAGAPGTKINFVGGTSIVVNVAPSEVAGIINQFSK